MVAPVTGRRIPFYTGSPLFWHFFQIFLRAQKFISSTWMHQQNVSHMLLPLSVWESLDVSMETAQSQLNTKDCQESYLAILLLFFIFS